MVNKKLLNKSLERYKEKNIDMKPVKYTKEIFQDLFNKYNNYGMYEYLYCCNGLEQHCWVEVIEEGNWGLTLEEVKKDILRNIKECKKYLYNIKRYGKDRLYVGKKDGVYYIYIYLRDKMNADYSIWFKKI